MARTEKEGLSSRSICCIVHRYNHHQAHHQKAPSSLPPALTTTRCYPPSVSPHRRLRKNLLRAASPPLLLVPSLLSRLYSPRFPPSASLRHPALPLCPTLPVARGVLLRPPRTDISQNFWQPPSAEHEANCTPSWLEMTFYCGMGCCLWSNCRRTLLARHVLG